MKSIPPEKQLKRERERILSLLEKLRKELATEVEFDADEYSPDLFEREKIVSTIEMFEHQLLGIEAALKRVRDGQYGICQDCGHPIGTGRLEIVPEATLCLACRSKAERSIR